MKTSNLLIQGERTRPLLIRGERMYTIRNMTAFAVIMKILKALGKIGAIKQPDTIRGPLAVPKMK